MWPGAPSPIYCRARVADERGTAIATIVGDVNGPFYKQWRDGDSKWAEATPEELEVALAMGDTVIKCYYSS